MLAKTKKEAKENLKTAIDKEEPKEIVKATIEIMLNDKKIMEDLVTTTKYVEPLLSMDLRQLKVLLRCVESAIKIKENKTIEGKGILF